MNISLVVAAGVHQGKVIPVAAPQFIIGRDPTCQLRPASQAISKQHCSILQRDTKVFVKDYGSTNGTFINDEQLTPNAEREVKAGDRIRLGPLDFSIQIVMPRPSDSTPIPDSLKALDSKTIKGLQAAAGVKPGSSAAQKPVPKPAAKPQPIPTPTKSSSDGGPESDDNIAAMLLGLDDDAPSTSIPEGSTVFEMKAVNPDGSPKPAVVVDPKVAKKGVLTQEESSSAASDILRKYLRRPR